jgi:hypothetical protein
MLIKYLKTNILEMDNSIMDIKTLFCNNLKHSLTNLFDDLLCVDQMTFYIHAGKALIENTESQSLMDHLAPEMINCDIDTLAENSNLLFNHIFSSLTKNNFNSEILQDMLKDFYEKLSTKDKTAIINHAKIIKAYCVKYNQLK